MNETVRRLETHQSATPSRWKEAAQARKANKEWLRYSQKIAMRMLDKMEEQDITQKQLAEKLQLEGHEFSDLTILRIEQGTRFVPDYEIVILAKFFNLSTDELLGL